MGVDRRLGARPFIQLVGAGPPSVFELMRIAANRAAAEPSQISANYMSLSPISAAETPRYNVVGGTERLALVLLSALGDRVRTGTPVEHVAREGDLVRIEVSRGGATIYARRCLIAVAAPIVRAIVEDPPAAKDAAPAAIPHGSYVVAGFFTREDRPYPWADRYMVIAPGRSFYLLFNAANASRPNGSATGGGFRVYAGGQRAKALFERTDDEIASASLRDLAPLAPTIDRDVVEVVIQRWPLGNPITAVGRAADQADIAAPLGPIHFADDYIGHPGMDSAAATAIHAAARIREHLEADEVRDVA